MTNNMTFAYDADFVRKNLRARLYNKSTKAEVFRSADKYGFDDLIIVPCLENIMDDGSVRVNKSLLEVFGMTEEEVLDIAEENSSQDTKAQSMAEVMAEIIGMELPEPEENEPQMIVVSNSKRTFGSYSIIPLLDHFKAKFPEGFAVLPSSVHEVIVVNYNEDGLDSMVQDVNTNNVRIEEQLSDHAYKFIA